MRTKLFNVRPTGLVRWVLSPCVIKTRYMVIVTWLTRIFRRKMLPTPASKAAPVPLGVLRGHSAPVNAVCAVTQASVASGSADGIVKLWDLRSRREKISIAAHSKAGVLHVTRLDERRMITHGRDGMIKMWDVDSFNAQSKPLFEWYCGSFTFTKVAAMRWRDAHTANEFSDLIISPSAEEKDVLVYDPRMNNATPAMFIHASEADKKRGMCMALSLFTSQPESSDSGASPQPYIAAGWEGGQFTLLDLRTGGKVASEVQVATGTNPLLAFDISRDGTTAICGSSSDELSAVTIDYSTLTMTTLPFFNVNHGGISCVRMRDDQRVFATAGWDHRARVFHNRKLKPLAILKYHTESVFCVDFTLDNNYMLTASKDHKIVLWSIYSPTPETSQLALKRGH